MTYQDLTLRFLGLSKTKLIFQDFPGSGNFTNTIPGSCRRHGNPEVKNTTPQKWILDT